METKEMIDKIYEKIAEKWIVESNKYSVTTQWICTVCWEKRKAEHSCKREYYKNKIMIWDILHYYKINWINCALSCEWKMIWNKDTPGSYFEIQFDDLRNPIEKQSEKCIELVYILI